MVFVFSQNLITLNLLIQDVLPGIGTTKSVSLALKIGSSMLIKFASQFLTNVNHTLKTEIVLHATKDTT